MRKKTFQYIGLYIYSAMSYLLTCTVHELLQMSKYISYLLMSFSGISIHSMYPLVAARFLLIETSSSVKDR